MFIAAHIGIPLGVLALTKYREKAMAVAFGSMAPDLLDKPLGFLLGSGRTIGHTLFGLVFIVVLALIWRSNRYSKVILVFAVGIATHLILDQMWRSPAVLFWPAYGFTFPAREFSLACFFHSLVTEPGVFISEIIGVIGIAFYIGCIRDEGRLYETAKRVGDVTAAFFGLVALLPASLIISATIWLNDGGSVFFTQERCGKGMSRFNLIKFRSMKSLKGGEQRKIINLKGDYRITPAGRLLRRYGLDSIPELLNVLIGDMSIVGPRPMPYEIHDEQGLDNIGQVSGIEKRSEVLPGITGIAQLYASKYISRRDKYRYDNTYINRRSIALDVRVFLRSMWYSRRESVD